MTRYDEMELDRIGTEFTALFVIISDTDDTFNFMVSILYTQMVCVGIYAAIVTDVVSSVDSFTLSSALWQVGAVTIVLCFALFKTGSIARSVFNSH